MKQSYSFTHPVSTVVLTELGLLTVLGSATWLLVTGADSHFSIYNSPFGKALLCICLLYLFAIFVFNLRTLYFATQKRVVLEIDEAGITFIGTKRERVHSDEIATIREGEFGALYVDLVSGKRLRLSPNTYDNPQLVRKLIAGFAPPSC